MCYLFYCCNCKEQSRPSTPSVPLCSGPLQSTSNGATGLPFPEVDTLEPSIKRQRHTPAGDGEKGQMPKVESAPMFNLLINIGIVVL